MGSEMCIRDRDTALSDEALTARCAEAGIRVRTLGSYYRGQVPEEDRSCLVINYSGLREEELERAITRLRDGI